MVGQIVCKCGRVAELRRRKNGRLLPFVQCKSCGMQQGKEEIRTQWLADENTSGTLGVYGEFPKDETSSNETSKNVKPEQVASSNKLQKEWVPDESNQPEKLEVEKAATPEPEQTSSNSGLSFGAKVGLGLLGMVALAFGVKNLNLPN